MVEENLSSEEGLKNTNRYDGVDWIYFAQDKVQRRTLVNMAMNLGVP
jgi:hypothetical protein